MRDYMKALHARFCREPELQKVQEELEQAYRDIKEFFTWMLGGDQFKW